MNIKLCWLLVWNINWGICKVLKGSIYCRALAKCTRRNLTLTLNAKRRSPLDILAHTATEKKKKATRPHWATTIFQMIQTIETSTPKHWNTPPSANWTKKEKGAGAQTKVSWISKTHGTKSLQTPRSCMSWTEARAARYLSTQNLTGTYHLQVMQLTLRVYILQLHYSDFTLIFYFVFCPNFENFHLNFLIFRNKSDKNIYIV